MKYPKTTSLKKALFLLLSFSFISSYSQTSDWSSDSLQFYSDKMDLAANSGDIEKMIDIQSHVYVKGTKSLKPEFYAFLYDLTADERITSHPLVLAKIRHNIGNLEFYRSKMDASKNNFKLALESYQEAGAKGDAAGMAMNLGIILERSQKYDSAIMAYEKAMPIFLEVGDTAAIAVCLENIGLAYRYKGDVKKGLSYLDLTDSLLTLITPEDNIRWSYLCYNYSTMYTLLGEYEKALEFALKGLRISEKNNDARQTNIGYVDLQDLYKKIGDEENWMKYVNKALTFAEESNNGMRVADLNYTIASYHIDHEDYDSAEFYVNKGLAYYKENDEVEGLGRGYLRLGNINYAQGEYKKAISAYTTALNSFTPSSIEVSRAYHSLGTSYMKIGQYRKANEYLTMALDMRLENGQIPAISSTYRALAENNELAGEYERAFDYYVTYTKYQDSIFNENKSKQLAELSLQYETEKKDQEILSLEKDNEIQALLAGKRKNQTMLAMGGLLIFLLTAGFFFQRSRTRRQANEVLQEKNQKIAQQNEEKEDLLKEIHHRVKNNLQIVSSLLNMQSRTLVDNNAIDAMKESQSRVKTMALIHEKLYQYDNLSRINMPEYLNQLSEFLAQTYRTEKEIQVIVESEDINLDIDTAVPLGLITNELLSNAWKYAFTDADNGLISVNLRKTQDGYSLEIMDSGKGIPEDMDISKSKSLGLKLVNSLTRQIQGQLHILDQSHGAAFRIEFSDFEIAA